MLLFYTHIFCDATAYLRDLAPPIFEGTTNKNNKKEHCVWLGGGYCDRVVMTVVMIE